MGEWVVLAAAALIVLRGALKGVDVYGAFLKGGKTGMTAAWHILPAVCAMTALLAVMGASGMDRALARLLSPMMGLLRLPEEAASVLLLRPMSGSGSLTALQQVFNLCGVDSRAGRAASVLMSASETIFYTMSVYLGATGIRKIPWVMGVSMIAYLAGAWVCGGMV